MILKEEPFRVEFGGGEVSRATRKHFLQVFIQNLAAVEKERESKPDLINSPFFYYPVFPSPSDFVYTMKCIYKSYVLEIISVMQL